MRCDVVVVALVALAPMACGGAPPATESSSNSTGDPVAVEEASSVAPSAGQDLDLEGLDLCQLVPGDVVAQAFGAELTREPSRQGSELMAECWYQVTHPGASGGTGEGYVLWVSGPDYFRFNKDNEELTVEELPGLGDDAYITWSEVEDQHSSHVLLEGRFEVGVYGPERERVLGLLELALDRL